MTRATCCVAENSVTQILFQSNESEIAFDGLDLAYGRATDGHAGSNSDSIFTTVMKRGNISSLYFDSPRRFGRILQDSKSVWGKNNFAIATIENGPFHFVQGQTNARNERSVANMK